MTKRTKKIPEKKLKEVANLAELVKNKKTLVIVSIKNIPASQYQEIVKILRGKAVVKVPKKSIIFRALDKSGNEAVKKIKEYIKESSAILFSDIDAFELSAELVEKKIPAKAKPGQEATKDIEVLAGPTELTPGPAISELGALGIKIQIEKGKINIKEPKIIAKKGEKISASAADLMGKLGMKPFTIGFVPLAAFDIEKGKLYLDIKIDKEGTIKQLKEVFSRALPFAVEIGYPSEETIKFVIGKAGVHGKALEKITRPKKKNSEDESEKKEKESVETEAKNSEKGEAEEKPAENNEKDTEVKSPKGGGKKDGEESKPETQKSEQTQENKQNSEEK